MQAGIVGAGETVWYHYTLPSPFHAISVTFTSLSAGQATVDFGAYVRDSGNPDFCHYIEPASCLRVLNRVACSVHGVVGDYNSSTYPADSYIVGIHNGWTIGLGNSAAAYVAWATVFDNT